MFAGLMQRALLSSVPAAVVAAATVTWDSAHSSTDWTLSGSNLIATRNVTTAGFWALLRATSAKASGTFIATVGSVGSTAFNQIGFDNGSETINLGASFNSIGWDKGGGVDFQGATWATYATWTTGDVLKFVKVGKDVSFYKNNVLQGTLDFDSIYNAANGTSGLTSPVTGAVYPAASDGNGTGMQVTIDGSLWV